MKIVVTGAAGFIGSNLVDFLLMDGHVVIGLDNMDDYYNIEYKFENLTSARCLNQFEFHKLDIRDKEAVNNFFYVHNPDLVVHLAARAGVRPSISDPLGYYEVNVLGTINILNAMCQVGCRNAIMASSSSVYGNNNVPFSEFDLVDSQISPYASSKKAMENICHVYSALHNLNITCLRFFTVYGPRLRPDLAIYKFVESIYSNKQITMFGKGDTSRDYTYITDIIDGINSAMYSLDSFKIFNLGGSNPVLLSELIKEIELATDLKANVEYLDLPPGDVISTYADLQKSQLELGYFPKVSLSVGMKSFVDWYKNNRL